MNIQFCNSTAYLIEKDELKEKVMVECESLFGMKLKRNRLFGPQPVAVERKDLNTLNEGYMVCEKTDGSRALLILINLNNKPMCFLINRNNELFFLELSFTKEVYEGSIFDGELVKTKEGSWNLLLHDCMCYNGTSFLNKNHRLRYACIIDFIVKRYVNKETDPVNIKTKLFYNFGNRISETWEHIKQTTENEIDGLIFTPINRNIHFGRDNFLFKWKLPEDNTVDFQIIFKGRKVYLYYTEDSELKLYKSFASTHQNYKKITEFNKINKITEESPIIEFKIINEDYFIPYRYRNDKNQPNSYITVLNTFKNVKEAIQVKDLAPAPSSASNSASGSAAGDTTTTAEHTSPAAVDLAVLTSRLALS
jgi:mRNA guanylyltransferase